MIWKGGAMVGSVGTSHDGGAYLELTTRDDGPRYLALAGKPVRHAALADMIELLTGAQWLEVLLQLPPGGGLLVRHEASQGHGGLALRWLAELVVEDGWRPSA